MTDLQLNDYQATINPHGGVIETFSRNGEDIFFVRQKIEGKPRGGCHVCAPYFGPGQAKNQPQHGYGRTVEWTVEAQETDKVTLRHQQTEGEYAGLTMELRYTLMPDGLLMELHLDNRSGQQLRVAPGFHPYFALEKEVTELRFNDSSYQINQLEGTEFAVNNTATATVNIGRAQYAIASDELKTYALWSAHPEKYVCVEPTRAGNSFHDNLAVPEDELLQPGEKSVYIVRISPL